MPDPTPTDVNRLIAEAAHSFLFFSSLLHKPVDRCQRHRGRAAQ